MIAQGTRKLSKLDARRLLNGCNGNSGGLDWKSIESNSDLHQNNFVRIYGDLSLQRCLEVIESEFVLEGGLPKTETFQIAFETYSHLRQEYHRKGYDTKISDEKLLDILTREYGFKKDLKFMRSCHDNLSSDLSKGHKLRTVGGIKEVKVMLESE